MRQRGIALLFLPVLLLACSHGAVLEDMMREHVTKSQEVLEWLKKCTKTCKEPDRDIAKDLAEGYQILYDVAAKNAVYSQLTPELKAKALVGQQKVRTGFLRILANKESRDILATAYRELANSDSLYTGADTEVETALHETIDRLLKKPTTAATAWYLTGMVTPVRSEDVAPAISAYRNCLMVDAQDEDCRHSYDELVRFYTRPRCKEPHFKEHLSLFSGKSVPEKGYAKKLVWGNATTFASSRPLLKSQDFLEASVEAPTPERNELVISLKTFSVPQLVRYMNSQKTGPADSRAEVLALQLKADVLAISPLLGDMTEGQVRVAFPSAAAAQTAFAKICQSAGREELPENLTITH